MIKLQKSSLVLILIIVVLTAGCVSIYTLGYAPGTVSHKAEDVKSGTFGSNVGSGNYNFPGNVGIKKTNPTSQLDVTGNIYTTGQVTAGTMFKVGSSELSSSQLKVNGSSLVVTSTGNVGIGTTEPEAKLNVETTDTATSPFQVDARGVTFNTPVLSFIEPNQPVFFIQSNTGNVGIGLVRGIGMPMPTPQAKLHIAANDYTVDPLRITAVQETEPGHWQTGVPVLNIKALTGNVGIGTTEPQAKLEVYGKPGTQKITTIPAGTTGTYTLDWNAFQICQFGTCCPPWKDCDGDGHTYMDGTDCDEGCSDCYVGSTKSTTAADGKDQNCNGKVDETEGLSKSGGCVPPYWIAPVLTRSSLEAQCRSWCEASSSNWSLYCSNMYIETNPNKSVNNCSLWSLPDCSMQINDYPNRPVQVCDLTNGGIIRCDCSTRIR